MRGGKIVEKKFKDLNKILSLSEDAIFNCLGAESKNIYKDENLEPKTIYIVNL